MPINHPRKYTYKKPGILKRVPISMPMVTKFNSITQNYLKLYEKYTVMIHKLNLYLYITHIRQKSYYLHYKIIFKLKKQQRLTKQSQNLPNFPRIKQKNKMQAVPTFAKNMQDLQKLKQQLLTINHMFSPNAVNYHQLAYISQLKTQLHHYHKQNTELQNRIKNCQKNRKEDIQKIEQERKQLEEVNLQLVGYNDKLVQQLETTSAKLQKLEQQLQHQRKHRKDLQLKHSRDIQNLKLMHSQQLYILKKKDKKQNS